MAKPIDPRVVDLHTRIFVNQLSLGDVLKEAGVVHSTYWRWAQGGDCKRSTIQRVSDAIDRLSHPQQET